jgi:hypothetical protein
MTDETGDKGGLVARIARAIEAHKKTTAGLVLAGLLAGATLFNTLTETGQNISSGVKNLGGARHEAEEAIASLKTEQTLEYVNSKLGEPQQSKDLCAGIRVCGQDTSHKPELKIYRNEYYTVRAVFDGNSMEFFAVTLGSGEVKPRPSWNPSLGPLGEFTYKEVSYGNAPKDLTKAAISIASGAKHAYAEVTPLGEPGHNRGLVLATAPDGYEIAWDRAAGQALIAVQDSSGGQVGLEAADAFRANSAPDTFGLFHDDGYVGNLLHDPQNVIQILYLGAEV